MTIYAKLHPYGIRYSGSVPSISGNTVSGTSLQSGVFANYGRSTGLWKFEVNVATEGADIGNCIGLARIDVRPDSAPLYGTIVYYKDGSLRKTDGTTVSSWGDTYTSGDIIEVAYKEGSVWFSKNGVWQNSGDPVNGGGEAETGISDTLYPYAYISAGATETVELTFRFNPSEFSYSAPSGFSWLPGESGVFFGWATLGPPGSFWQKAGYWTDGSGFSNSGNSAWFGETGGAAYHSFLYFDNFFASTEATPLTVTLYFGASTTVSVDDCNIIIGMEDADNPSAPVNNADIKSRVITSAQETWGPVEHFVSGTVYTCPENLSNVLKEVISRPGWVDENAILLMVKDNGSDSGAYRRYGKKTGNGIWDSTHLLVEWRIGSITYEVGREDHAGLGDSIDGGVTPTGMVSDTTGMGDTVEAPLPAHGKPIDDVGLGDEVIADHLVETVSEDIGLSDQVDSFSLSPVTEDNAGLNDFIDAYIMSVGASDESGFDDTTDATADATLNVSNIEHKQEIQSLEIEVNQAPLITADFSIPGPTVTADMSGIQADFAIPGPSITARLSGLAVIQSEFNIPGPAVTAAIQQNKDISAAFNIPGPDVGGTISVNQGISARFGIPGPAVTAELSQATSMTATFTIPGPVIDASMKLNSRFGILEHSRC